MGGQGGDGLPLWDCRPPGHAGEDYALAHPRQGVLRPQRRSRPAEGRHPGGDVVGDAQLIQSVHLFPDGPVETGVPSVEADGVLPRLHSLQYLLQGHLGAVINGAVRTAQLQQGGIHQTAGVNHHIRLSEQFRPPESDQVRGSRPRPYKVDHLSISSFA